MTWDFLLFLLCFFLQAGLLGLVMYGLICISDLENDFINPHDASDTLNKWALPEYVVQSVMTGLLLAFGKWATGGVHLCMAIYNWREYLRGDHRVDATDVFQKVGYQKKLRLGKLVFYLVSFVLLIYKLVAAAVHHLVSHGDRQAAHKIIQDAAASFRL